MGIKTDELLIRAIVALERALAIGSCGKRAKPSNQSGNASLTPASIPSPGDKNDAGPVASSNTIGERCIAPKARAGKEKTPLSPQDELDL